MKINFNDILKTPIADQLHHPAQLGPVAATAAPTNVPTPPKNPPTAALNPIETAQSPEAAPPCNPSISSIVNFLMMMIIKLIVIDQHTKTPEDGIGRVTLTGLV